MFSLKYIVFCTLLALPFHNALADDYINAVSIIMKQCYEKHKRIDNDFARCIMIGEEKVPNHLNYEIMLNAESETSDELLLQIYNSSKHLTCLVTVGNSLEIKVCKEE
ncbi:hypothetical protein [Legionella hackeliae]|uniref:Uncharacterized protein n=1 Tax=Legionella hackeliae TaxID=449 RepID=A0A0A8UQY5_LEGHA|nr:hypothetical protein [Legionella hackeliae]KTD14867.1 hypothetical protein Lhac_0397 [Legionella hackeliae]CEK09507.1 exported protein of unknown function [Legionella hackeliae]STX49414.1 Uncharacterised protein [Legionella hackeliae]